VTAPAQAHEALAAAEAPAAVPTETTARPLAATPARPRPERQGHRRRSQSCALRGNGAPARPRARRENRSESHGESHGESAVAQGTTDAASAETKEAPAAPAHRRADWVDLSPSDRGDRRPPRSVGTT